MDQRLEELSDEQFARLLQEIEAGTAPPEPFARVALSVQQAVVVAERFRGSCQRESVVRVGRIEPPTPTGGLERFFDPGEPSRRAEVVLRRVETDGVERFELLTPLAYWDEGLGVLIVPGNQRCFRSDLTSVPWLFTWLVPRTGNHLPAALLHDGLVLTPGEPRSYIGPEVPRAIADRLMRDGMRHLGTGPVRRWLVWGAVSLATMSEDPDRWTRWRWRLVVALTFLVIAVLGVWATVDLFDHWEGLAWFGGDTLLPAGLPWMGASPTYVELLRGGLFALVIPVVLAGLLWPGRRRVGVLFGIALAFLLHVTVALAAVYGVYAFLEGCLTRSPRRALAALGGLLVIAAVPGLLVLWARSG